jgi:PHD/YefM family antitoxin component YafN of YafNO toxin-antitoxin module
MIINANEIKKRGVSVFDNLLHKFDELIINVRGKEKYVVLDIERYREFRAKELDLAYLEAMRDLDEGHVKHQRADEHLEELAKELKLV